MHKNNRTSRHASLVVFACAGMLLLGVSTILNVQAIAPANVACTITMDGSISSTEWACADSKTAYYLNVDNNPDGNGHINEDGNNYLYLAEDMDNVYVGLDLCSDRSTDEAQEWIGMWLATAGRTFSGLYANWSEWGSFVNNGTESLLYSVPDQATMPFLNDGLQTKGVFPNSESEYLVVTGTAEGNAVNLGDPAYQAPFNISAAHTTDYVTRVDFTVDMKRCFDVAPEEWIEHLTEVQILLYSSLNQSITYNKMVVWYANGTSNVADTDQVFDINAGTGMVADVVIIDTNNLTSNHEVKISLIGQNPSAFKQVIDSISFIAKFNNTNHIRTGNQIYYPYSSIKTYQLVKGFGTSADCSENHRMFEIRIPKSEIEHYDSNENLGIIVGGYGTLAFVGSNYWVFSSFMGGIQPYDSSRYIYIDMLGISVPLPNEIPGYDMLILAGVAGGFVTCLVSKRIKATRKQ